MLSITPSLPAQSFTEIKELATTLLGTIPMLQVDIVDGEFVPAVSWPFTEPRDACAELLNLQLLPPSLPLEMDCMVMRPELYLETFVSLSVANVIVHLGSTDAYDAIITHARTYRYQIGIALTNDRDLSELTPYIDRIDFVQVMGIAHVGKQGQPFDERTLTTLRTLRAAYPTLPLSVDGAVNSDTILKLRDAGATRFAPGSAIAKAADPVHAYKQLAHMIGLM
jgi:pentose-5-phosphate-3-epimerase